MVCRVLTSGTNRLLTTWQAHCRHLPFFCFLQLIPTELVGLHKHQSIPDLSPLLKSLVLRRHVFWPRYAKPSSQHFNVTGCCAVGEINCACSSGEADSGIWLAEKPVELKGKNGCVFVPPSGVVCKGGGCPFFPVSGWYPPFPSRFLFRGIYRTDLDS